MLNTTLNDTLFQKTEEIFNKLQEHVKVEEEKRKIKININENTDPSILAEAKKIDIEPSSYEKLKKEIESDTYISAIGPIKRFDPHENLFNLNLLITVVGKRRTGKTHFVNDFLTRYFKKFENFLILTDTKFNNYWTQRFPSAFVKDDYDDKYLMLLFEIQAEKKRRLMKKYKNITDKELNSLKEYQCVIILDDVVGDVYELRFGQGLVKLATMGRHIGCTVIFCSQYFFAIPIAIRGNTDLSVILPQSQQAQIDGIAKNYLGFIDPKVARILLEDIPLEEKEISDFKNPNYIKSKMAVRVMIIAIFANRTLPSDLIYWYSADEEVPVHKFMNKKLWNSNINYDY